MHDFLGLLLVLGHAERETEDTTMKAADQLFKALIVARLRGDNELEVGSLRPRILYTCTLHDWEHRMFRQGMASSRCLALR